MHDVNFTAYPPVSDVLSQTLNRRLLKAAESFAASLEKMGYPTPAYSESALLKLTQTSDTKKEEIVANFERWSEWINPLEPNKTYENEITLLKKALESHGLQADTDFFKKIEQDQIIEFYDENMIQLYRSFNFYKFTGYSLLDISLNEWYVLWDRPRQSLESIFAELNESLTIHIPVKEFRTKKHIIRETFNASQSKEFKPRVCLLNPVRLGSLQPRQYSLNKRKGFICTASSEIIATGKEVDNIRFV